MADFMKLAPQLIRWETGVDKKGCSFVELFEAARKKGFSCDEQDRGGATMCGITIATFRVYYGKDKTAEDLKKITAEQWLYIYKNGYWNRWMADYITSQPVANIVVDWLWASGRWGIVKVQKILGVDADGVVGTKTISALNSESPLPLFAEIKKQRLDFIKTIVNNSVRTYEEKLGRKATDRELLRHTMKRFQEGWERRINSYRYE